LVTAQATAILKATLALPAVGITNPSSHHSGLPGYCYPDNHRVGRAVTIFTSNRCSLSRLR